MTRPFNQRVICEQCGQPTTAESAFERWFRANPSLESRSGIVRFDLDVLLHKYKTVNDLKSSRDVQCMMFIEVKTHMAEPSDSQRDTLRLLDAVLRNRKENMHKRPRYQLPGAPNMLYSLIAKRDIRLFLLGGHLLQMSGVCPVSSDYMIWDRKHPIGIDELIKLLRFDLDPDDPTKPPDIRRRSQSFRDQKWLFDH